MNTLLLGLIIFFNSADTNSVEARDYSWVLEEMQDAAETHVDYEFSRNKIKIFDMDGNILGQYNQEEFVKNKLPLTDLKRIQDSEFLFEYQGDSYYLKD